MKIYVASSWRNARQPAVVAALREAGHEVYDFRNPAPGDDGFSWRETDPRPPSEWTAEEFREILKHPVAQHGFSLDMGALRWCEACVLVLPCGRSAHLELGWATGAGRRTIVLCERLDEPELMYLMNDAIATSLAEVLSLLAPAPAQAGSNSPEKGDAIPEVRCPDCEDMLPSRDGKVPAHDCAGKWDGPDANTKAPWTAPTPPAKPPVDHAHKYELQLVCEGCGDRRAAPSGSTPAAPYGSAPAAPPDSIAAAALLAGLHCTHSVRLDKDCYPECDGNPARLLLAKHREGGGG